MAFRVKSVSIKPEQELFCEEFGLSFSELLQQAIDERRLIADQTRKELRHVTENLKKRNYALEYITDKLQATEYKDLVSDALSHASVRVGEEKLRVVP